MFPRLHLVIPGLLLVVIAAAAPARGEPITVTFTVFSAPGDLVNPASASGSFAFDSSLIPSGGGKVENVASGLGATDIQFTWGHTLWTTSNADLGELRFSSCGTLLDFFLAGKHFGLTGFQRAHRKLW
jgi:hypothetical protein